MAKQREAERVLAPGEIPQEGCDVLLSGKDKSKRLHVTPARRCADWLKFELSDDGHETLVVKKPSDLAKSMGFDSVEVLNGAPAPVKPAPAKSGEPLPVAVKAGK